MKGKEKRIPKRLGKTPFSPREALLRINVEPTNACNLRCTMCSDLGIRPKGFMEVPLFEKIVREYAALDTGSTPKEIGLWQSGEPLLHPEIHRLVSIARKAGIRTSIYTNGLKLTEGLSEALLKAGLDRLTVSMNKIREETYLKYVPGGNFQKMVENMRNFLTLRDRGLGKTYVTFQIIFPRREWKALQTNVEAMEEMTRFRKEIGSPVDVEIRSTFRWAAPKFVPEAEPPTPILFDSRGVCFSFYNFFSVAWNGDILPCCSDLNGLAVLGNMRDSTVNEAWEEILPSFRLAQLRKESIPLCDLCYIYMGKALPFQNLEKCHLRLKPLLSQERHALAGEEIQTLWNRIEEMESVLAASLGGKTPDSIQEDPGLLAEMLRGEQARIDRIAWAAGDLASPLSLENEGNLQGLHQELEVLRDYLEELERLLLKPVGGLDDPPGRPFGLDGARDKELKLSGWAAGLVFPLDRVEAVLGGSPVGKVSYGKFRADLKEAYPFVQNIENKGFEILIDVKGVSPGMHEFTILAVNRHGTRNVLGKRVFFR